MVGYGLLVRQPSGGDTVIDASGRSTVLDQHSGHMNTLRMYLIAQNDKTRTATTKNQSIFHADSSKSSFFLSKDSGLLWPTMKWSSSGPEDEAVTHRPNLEVVYTTASLLEYVAGFGFLVAPIVGTFPSLREWQLSF